ncbi:MAG TPA: AAA family ATPase [Clostridium sp.]|uniref:ParA family protein n=1 Tax=Clostridium sp. TaxID=1506 RepID=UPI002F93291F
MIEGNKAPVITFINMKGGVGKTTLCIGIGEYLANELGKKVLILDIDPQFNATQSLLDKYELVDQYLSTFRKEKTIRKLFATTTDVYQKNTLIGKEEVIHKFNDNLHMVFGDINLIFDNNTMDNTRIKRVLKFINGNSLKDEYDYILIDSPPTISMYTDASIVASDYYIVPVKIDNYSILGVTNLISVITNLKADEELNIEPLGVIYTNLDDKLTLKTQTLKDEFELEENIEKLYIFQNGTTYVRDLQVGGKGNIASHYKKSREDIALICEELEAKLRGEI